jgi:hypothetical protein
MSKSYLKSVKNEDLTPLFSLDPVVLLNWQGRPLRSFEIAIECIRSTSNKKGLKVDAILNTKEYQKGIKISDHQMKQINHVRHDELPLWNYSLVPKGSIKNAN